MKKTSILKKVLLLLTFATTTLFFVSCDNNKRTNDSGNTTEKRNTENIDNKNKITTTNTANTNPEKDARFLVSSAEMSLEEIKLGQLAQQKGTTTQVKELGKMMEDAHTRSLRDLSALAQTKRITIPTSPTGESNDSYAKLNKKSGKDFDKAYADRMVSEHKDAIETFEKAAADSYDTDVKNWASASLPELRKHLDHSIDCQKKSEKM